MIRIRCMSAPQVGDLYRLNPNGNLMTNYFGLPLDVADDDAPEIASWPIARVAAVGAYWSNQPEGTSGYYVEIERVNGRS